MAAEKYSVKAVLSAVDSGFISTFDRAQNATHSLMDSVKGTAVGASIFKMISGAVSALASNVDSAVKRFDTLNQYPRVLQQMGYSAADASQSIKDLGDGIQYVPTSLDEIAASAKLLTLTTGSLKKSTKLAIAMNNAFYASGSASEEASRGMEQFTQMLSKGKVEQEEWNTLNETMKYGLMQTAKKLGIADGNTNKLKDALQDGTITLDQFTDAIIECSEETGGFAELAKTSTEGISISMTNMKIAITKGLTGSIQAIDTFLAANNLPTITGLIDGAKDTIAESFDFVNKKIETFGETEAFKTVCEYANAFANTVQVVGPSVVDILEAIGDAFWALASDAQTVSEVKGILDSIGVIAQTTAGFITENSGAVKEFIGVAIGMTIALKGIRTALAIGSSINAVTASLKALIGSGEKTSKTLPKVGDDLGDVGDKAGASGNSILTSAKAFALMGVGVLAVSIGFALLAQAAIALANAGGMAIGVMFGMVAAIALLGAGMMLMLNSVTAAPATINSVAIAMLAMGAAIVLCGVGFALLAQSAIALAESGGTAIAVMGGMVVAIALLAAGVSVIAPALTAGAIGMLAFGAAIIMVGTGLLIASAAASVVAGVLPVLAQYGEKGAVAFVALGAGLLVFGAGATVAGAGAIVAAAGIAAFAIAGTTASVGFVALSASLGGVKKKMKSIASSTTTVSESFGTMKSALQSIPSALSQISAAAQRADASYASSVNDMVKTSDAAGTQMGVKLASGLAASTGMVSSIARSVAISAASAMRAGYSTALSSGRYIGQGLAIGLESSYGQVASAAALLAKAADDAVRAKAKIGSPSRVAIKTFTWIGKGAAIGLEKMKGAVARASEELFSIPSLYEPDLAFVGGGTSSYMQLDDSYSYNSERKYEFTIPLYTDSRRIAEATAVYTEEELAKRERISRYRKGTK